MSRAAAEPHELTRRPFLGTDVIARGLLTRRQLSTERWRRLLPDVYVWQGLEIDHWVRCAAAGLFLRGRGAISGRDAATLMGADILRPNAPIEVTVPRPTRFRTPEGLKVVRSPLPAGDTVAWAGIRLTSAGRTAFDLARRLDLREAVVGVDAMLAKGLLAKSDLAVSAGRRPGWPGVPQMRIVLLLCDAKAESPQESRLRLMLVAGDLPWPVTQYEVFDAGRFVARLDLAYPDRRLGVEYDGDQHRSTVAFRNDVRRLNALRTWLD